MPASRETGSWIRCGSLSRILRRCTLTWNYSAWNDQQSVKSQGGWDDDRDGDDDHDDEDDDSGGGDIRDDDDEVDVHDFGVCGGGLHVNLISLIQ